MAHTQNGRIDWDSVYYAIRTTMQDVDENKPRHEMLAAMQAVDEKQYLAAMLTRAIQSVIDFTFQEHHDWKGVYTILRTVCEDYADASRTYWIAEARRQKVSVRDYTCAKLTRYVAEVIDFDDYMSQSGSLSLVD